MNKETDIEARKETCPRVAQLGAAQLRDPSSPGLDCLRSLRLG